MSELDLTCFDDTNLISQSQQQQIIINPSMNPNHQQSLIETITKLQNTVSSLQETNFALTQTIATLTKTINNTNLSQVADTLQSVSLT